MGERHLLLRCPVCLGTALQRRALGGEQPLHVDCCRRCGGVWLDHGEVQRLRQLDQTQLWQHLVPRPRPMRVPCHDCHAPMERSDAACAHCGWTNALDCPVCDHVMLVESHAGLRLDVCRTCKGVWFDHHQLKEIWSAHLDLALQKRSATVNSPSSADGRVMEDVLFNALFFAPDVIVQGTATGMATVADVSVHMAGAMAGLPEASAATFEAAGEAASRIFETIVEIIGGVFR